MLCVAPQQQNGAFSFCSSPSRRPLRECSQPTTDGSLSHITIYRLGSAQRWSRSTLNEGTLGSTDALARRRLMIVLMSTPFHSSRSLLSSLSLQFCIAGKRVTTHPHTQPKQEIKIERVLACNLHIYFPIHRILVKGERRTQIPKKKKDKTTIFYKALRQLEAQAVSSTVIGIMSSHCSSELVLTASHHTTQPANARKTERLCPF